MTIQEFAEVHSVRVRRDGCSEIIIPGRFFNAELRRERVEYGSHIYENGDGRFGVCLLFATKMRWTLAKRKLIAEGFVLKQDGDTEGTLLFDPDNAAQARIALKIARVKSHRAMSPKQVASLAAARAKIALGSPDPL